MTHPASLGDHRTWTDPRGRDHTADVIARDGADHLVVVLDDRVPVVLNPAELH